jgi:hypothetical protein
MANRAEECRLRAEQREQTAKAATDPTEQCIYAELARQWRQMAAQAEVLEQRRAEKAGATGAAGTASSKGRKRFANGTLLLAPCIGLSIRPVSRHRPPYVTCL